MSCTARYDLDSFSPESLSNDRSGICEVNALRSGGEKRVLAALFARRWEDPAGPRGWDAVLRLRIGCMRLRPSQCIVMSVRTRVSAMIRVWRRGRPLGQESNSARMQDALIVVLRLPRNSRAARPQSDHIWGTV